MRKQAQAPEFIAGLRWADVPARVRRRIESLIHDFAAVTGAGAKTATAPLAANYAVQQHAGDQATLLYDGRRSSATGAAWANGVLANALDLDDGHRLAKGHPGACVIPSALAVGELVGATREDVLAAIAVGYEIALRAGIALHARATEYHGSGAWGAIGAAAAGARLLGLDPTKIGHALGLAEHQGPMAPVMRSVAEPAMTKDACGWGAMVGTSAVLLAADGFTATESTAMDHLLDEEARLGRRWHVDDVYVKAYPCCRWSQPAITAALHVRSTYEIPADRIASVTVRTFAAAAALSRRPPMTTEEAQYSLVWPVACALVFGGFEVSHVLPPFNDPRVHDLAGGLRVEVDPILEAWFPAVRRASVIIMTTDGESYESDLHEAPGEPEDPHWADIVADKFARYGRRRLPTDSPLMRLL